MTREQYNSLQLSQIRELAKARGLKGVSALRKNDLIDRMLEEDEKSADSSIGQEASGEGIVRREVPSARSESRNPDRGVNRGDDHRRESRGSAHRNESHDTERGVNRNPDRSANRRTDRGGSRNADRSGNRNQDRNANRNSDRNGNAADRDVSRNQDRSFESHASSGTDGWSDDHGIEDIRSNDYVQDMYMSDDPNGNRDMFDEGVESQEENKNYNKKDVAALDSGNVAEGILEVLGDGYGFIRSANFLPGDDDVYVSPSQIRKFRLKTGDILYGNTRIKTQNEKFSALLFIKSVNGMNPSVIQHRYDFEDMTPIFPNERIHLERNGGSMAMRIMDLVAPVGKGQRGMIVSPPKAGKTTLLKDTARSILRNNPEMHLIILLVDERPEEVTDIRETVQGDNVEVIYSTFDETPDHHRRVSEMVIERAKRLVESNLDVTIFIDSITRLARAYNQVIPPSGRTLSGGLDPAALHMPKKFFGAARNMREGGSLTILATALVDTGSKMDDVVYEEFKGTGNMELILDRKLQERRVFPAIDIAKSGTRREDLLLDKNEQEAVNIMRRSLNGMKAEEAAENILHMFTHTRNNRELVNLVIKRKQF